MSEPIYEASGGSDSQPNEPIIDIDQEQLVQGLVSQAFKLQEAALQVDTDLRGTEQQAILTFSGNTIERTIRSALEKRAIGIELSRPERVLLSLVETD